MKKYVLFGAGNFGCDALFKIGDENVEYFCDNNEKIVGTKKYEKTIISFSELKEIHSNYIIVICANLEKSYVIADQLESNNIYDYIPYIVEFCQKLDSSDWNNISEDIIKRSNVKCQFYKDKYRKVEIQLDYFKSHADISTMKPATGELRIHQLDEVSALREFNGIFEQLNVRPFLSCGNLLGYIRHHGFIPWDDDIDLYMIRNEYERFKKYCFENFEVMCSVTGKVSSETLNKFLIEHPNKWCVFEHYKFFQVIKMDDKGSIINIDYFVMDYFKDDYAYSEYRRYLSDLYSSIIELKSIPEQIKFVRKSLLDNKNIVNESNNLYFGIDNMDSYILYDKGEWISKDTIFPLRRVDYEGSMVWIPNKPEKFLEYQYENIYKFPNDVGIQRHRKYEED